jgi:hypothetical protein
MDVHSIRIPFGALLTCLTLAVVYLETDSSDQDISASLIHRH